MELNAECEATILFSSELAANAGHLQIQPWHLAEAALDSPSVERMLNRCGASANQFQQSLEKYSCLGGPGSDRLRGTPNLVSTFGEKAIKGARTIASELGDESAGPEHLFLGACDVGSTILDFVLGEHNLTITDLREALCAIRRADRSTGVG